MNSVIGVWIPLIAAIVGAVVTLLIGRINAKTTFATKQIDQNIAASAAGVTTQGQLWEQVKILGERIIALSDKLEQARDQSREWKAKAQGLEDDLADCIESKKQIDALLAASNIK